MESTVLLYAIRLNFNHSSLRKSAVGCMWNTHEMYQTNYLFNVCYFYLWIFLCLQNTLHNLFAMKFSKINFDVSQKVDL